MFCDSTSVRSTLLTFRTGVRLNHQHHYFLYHAKITAQKDKNGIQQIAGEPRYRIGDTWVRSTIDDWNGKEIRRSSFKVTKIEKGLVYIEGDEGLAIATLDGAAVQTTIDGGWKFDPPRI